MVGTVAFQIVVRPVIEAASEIKLRSSFMTLSIFAALSSNEESEIADSWCEETDADRVDIKSLLEETAL